MNKTINSAVMKKLESKVKTDDNVSVTNVDVRVVVAMFLIRSMTNLPPTFQGIAKNVLSSFCCSSAKEVHLISDCYNVSSITDLEQDNRAK